MIHGKHSAILSTYIKLSFVIKIFVLSILSGCFTQVLLYCNMALESLDEDVIYVTLVNSTQNSY